MTKVAVKPLKWSKDVCGNYHADTPWGKEYIQRWDHVGGGDPMWEYEGKPYRSLEDAQDAVIAALTFQILSAIEVTE